MLSKNWVLILSGSMYTLLLLQHKKKSKSQQAQKRCCGDSDRNDISFSDVKLKGYAYTCRTTALM